MSSDYVGGGGEGPTLGCPPAPSPYPKHTAARVSRGLPGGGSFQFLSSQDPGFPLAAGVSGAGVRRATPPGPRLPDPVSRSLHLLCLPTLLLTFPSLLLRSEVPRILSVLLLTRISYLHGGYVWLFISFFLQTVGFKVRQTMARGLFLHGSHAKNNFHIFKELQKRIIVLDLDGRGPQSLGCVLPGPAGEACAGTLSRGGRGPRSHVHPSHAAPQSLRLSSKALPIHPTP